MRRLFVFRPEPGATTTVTKARSLGLDAVGLPLFRVDPVEWRAPDPSRFDALLLTSANAVRLAGSQLDRLRRLPVHAVGEATAVACEVAGLGVASVGKGGLDELLATIAPEARLLHLCGQDRRDPREPRQAITCVTVYRSNALPAPQGIGQLSGAVALVHSPRAAARLAELVPVEARSTVRLAAISEAAAHEAGAGWERVEAAGSPEDDALLAVASRLCDKGRQQ